MDIRPVDLPELRNEALISQDAGGYTLQQWLMVGQGNGRNAEDSRAMWRWEIERLAAAPLFFVSPEMARLAQAAACSLPGFTVHPEDLPSSSGFMVFGSEIDGGVYTAKHPTDPGERSSTRALHWSCSQGQFDGVYVTGYLDRDACLEGALADGEIEQAANLRHEPRLMLVADTTFAVPFGEQGWEELLGSSPSAGNLPRPIADLLPVLLAAWLLMQQPLAEVTEAEPDRSTKRRLRRSGAEPASVRVIELRRPKGASAPVASPRDWQHQWIVRGHWRQQWHPKREVHRPVWIAPHLKGPEGAPLIGGEKVYAWKR